MYNCLNTQRTNESNKKSKSNYRIKYQSEEDKGNKAACYELGRQVFTICYGRVLLSVLCVCVCVCVGLCLHVFSVSAEEILVRRGSFLELDTYLSLSGLSQLFREK